MLMGKLNDMLNVMQHFFHKIIDHITKTKNNHSQKQIACTIQ